jgi:enoyl-CoA hydratase/3-hydroxyacyl-CoA dehydrogenase
MKFFNISSHEQVPGVTDRGLVPRQVKKVAILGGGLMGSGIATALILGNYPVILKEVNEKFLEAGVNRVKGEKRSL